MPLESTWMLDKRVVYFRVYGDVSGAEIVATMQTHMQHYEVGIAPVHTIVEMQSPAINVPSLMQLQKLGVAPRHPNTGWIILLGTERNLVSFAIATMIQLSGAKDYRAVKTLDEAVSFLNHNDPTLNLELEAAENYIASRARS